MTKTNAINFSDHQRIQTYTPQHVANFFIDKSIKEDICMDLKKLLKLVYIGYGWVTALTGKPLFDEKIEAWEWGEVTPSVYHEFKRFQTFDIGRRSCTFDLDSDGFCEPSISRAEDVFMILGKVWFVYKEYDKITSRQDKPLGEKDTPWSETYEKSNPNEEIPSDLIQTYFSKKIKMYLDHTDDKEISETEGMKNL